LVLLRALSLSTLLLVTFGCTPSIRVGTYPDVSLIEANLQRGISTLAEITALLGSPSGSGSFALPIDFGKSESQTYLYGAGEVLFYQDIELKDYEVRGELLQVDMRQRILVVFVRDDLFDGFMWYSNEGVVEGKQ
jgi:hypothetical protein